MVCVICQEISELERQLSEERASGLAAERRAEHAQLVVIAVEDKLQSFDETINQQEQDVQHQLIADHKRVCIVSHK